MTDNQDEERQLIEQAQAGDVVAFEAIYRRYSGRVFGLCARITSDRAEAEDCTQETFITAWRKLPEFRGDSQLMTWLHAIAYHRVMDLHRTRARQANHLAAVASDTLDPAGPAHDEHRDLETLVARLPARAREAIVLQKIYGYTHAEAAEIMGTTAGACKAQVHRAMKLLAAALPADDDAGVTAETTG